MDILDTTEKVNERIAKNLAYYRKAAGYTQAQLAQRINYSDKSVSKWESANGIPDIYVLLKLAKLYGVTVSDLVGDNGEIKAIKKTSGWVRPLVALLSSGIIWLVATVVFVTCSFINSDIAWWMAFVYALPINAILMVVLSGVWRLKMVNFISISFLVWSALLCAFMTVRLVLSSLGKSLSGIWLIFMLGVPLQILEICWYFFRRVKRSGKVENKKNSNNS